MTIKALLWDVDGTLAETERDGHRVAFNRAFEACGLPWRWTVERYGELLTVTGGRERLLHDMQSRPDAPPIAAEREALARHLHQRKNGYYAEIVSSRGIALRSGVAELLDEAEQAGVRLAITTTTSKVNVDALLRSHFGHGWTRRFSTLVCGEDVQSKKPDPEVFSLALQRLGISPLQALAIEDSPGGVAAARAADVPVVVTRSIYFARDSLEGAIAIGPGLDCRDGWHPALPDPTPHRVTLADLEHWHQRMDFVTLHA